jgi:hypothetical protein
MTECQTASADKVLLVWMTFVTVLLFLYFMDKKEWLRDDNAEFLADFFPLLGWVLLTPPPPLPARKWPSVLASRLFGLAPRRVTWPPSPLASLWPWFSENCRGRCGGRWPFRFFCVFHLVRLRPFFMEREANRAKILYSKAMSKFLAVFYRDRRLILRSYRPYIKRGFALLFVKSPDFSRMEIKKYTREVRLCFPRLKGWFMQITYKTMVCIEYLCTIEKHHPNTSSSTSVNQFELYW